MNENIDLKIKDLSLNYGIKEDHLYYLKYKKNYSDNKIKQTVFETKYGKGCDKTNYFNYYLPRILDKSNNFTIVKREFFTNFKLSNSLNRSIVENLWEELMNYRSKL